MAIKALFTRGQAVPFPVQILLVLFKFQIKERIAKIEEFIKDPEPIEKKFTFGHFFPIKYFGSYGKEKDVFLTTFLRDPISRLASHYSFWSNSGKAHYLQKKMTMENWSFEEFAEQWLKREFPLYIEKNKIYKAALGWNWIKENTTQKELLSYKELYDDIVEFCNKETIYEMFKYKLLLSYFFQSNLS